MDSVLQPVISDIRLSADRLFVATVGRLPMIAWAVAVVVVTWGLASLARRLGGLALGFALKDIISNFVSGLLILLTHAFDIGDQIVVGKTEGTVERIELRATHIRTRASVFVYLDYRVDLDRAMAVILEAVAGVPGVSPDPLASMRLRDLTPQSLQIEASRARPPGG